MSRDRDGEDGDLGNETNVGVACLHARRMGQSKGMEGAGIGDLTGRDNCCGGRCWDGLLGGEGKSPMNTNEL